jgi:hypothetical protein
MSPFLLSPTKHTCCPQATWATQWPTCNGNMQSPIDLDSSIATHMSPGEISMIDYNLAMSGLTRNNGRFLEFIFADRDTGGTAPYIEGGRLPAGERLGRQKRSYAPMWQ